MTTYTKDIYGVQQQLADEQAAQEQGYITEAVNLASVQGAGMMLNARDIGMRQGNVYANIGRMLTGEEEAVDPRLVRMQKLQAIMEQVPEPDTVDEYIQLANLMNQAGLYGEAQEAMKMANEIRSSMPAKSNAWKEYTEMTSNPTPEGFQIWYDKYKVTGSSKPTSYQEYALTTNNPTTQGYAEHLANKGDKDEPNYILDDFIQTSYDTLLEENPNMDKKDLLNQAHVAGQKLFDEYETALKIAREGGNFLNQIESLQSVINPDTLEGKPLYDATHPNGRYFTEAEAVEEARHNIRLSEDQVYSQLVDKTNLENTNTYHLASTQSADTARTNLRDFKEMLQLLQMGASTGFSQDFKDDWRSLFLSLGFTDKDLAVNEVLRTKMKKLALDRLSALKGAASDKDIEFVEAAGAQMNKSELANKVILEIAQVYAQDEIDLYYQMNGWLDKYKSEHNGRYPALNTYKAQEKIFIDSKKPISERIKVTMEQLLAIEPDWEYTDTSADMVNNTFLLEGLIKKYGVK